MVHTSYDVVWPFSVPGVFTNQWTEEDWMGYVLGARPKGYEGSPFDKEAYAAWRDERDRQEIERAWPEFDAIPGGAGVFLLKPKEVVT